MATSNLDLNGTWQLGWADGVRGVAVLADRDAIDPARFFAAQVPGEVHLDLERAGVIDDVRLGLNALKARWVEETRWIYRKEFDAPPEALAPAGAWLVFEGLDLTARVVLNGTEIGKHNNAFTACRINVAGKLRAGRNVLAVHIESGMLDAQDKPIGRYQYIHDHRIARRHWLRKAGAQFGWDWATRLTNVGIFKPARLEWARAACVEQLSVSAELSPDLKRGTVRARLFVEGVAETRATVSARIGDVTQTSEVTIKPGPQTYDVTLNVENPELWWPAEHGDQRLYDVVVTLTAGGETIERHARVGFRHVRFIQDPHPTQPGRYFILEVNGRKIFAKGANWAPADLILARCDRARYTALLARAREAHFNFFRINGCGIYENDAFYDLCDELGIMIWQDFPFSNIHYPFGDPEFLAGVSHEARVNVRRIRQHPSLIVWCGNNEMEWLGGGEKTRGTEIDDITFFHETLANIVKEEDPTRYYQPSSPFSPDGIEPNVDHAGNQHPWSLGFKDNDIHKFREMTCRFPTEGGMLGAPALPSIRASLTRADERTWSFAWQHHDNSVAIGEHPSFQDQMIRDWMGKDVREMSVEEYCYWAGLFQAEALREFADNFRRRMFDSAAAAFWDFNDFWPVTRGWAIVDAQGRRAPAFYAVRRAFAPISVVVTAEGQDVCVYGVNDRADAVKATLRYGVFELAGAYPIDRNLDVTLAPNASTRLTTFPRSSWTHPENSAAFAVLSQGRTVLARNRIFLPRFKDLRWPDAGVTVRVGDGVATFSSPTFVWGVCLDLDGERALGDNFFDVYPGQPHAIAWTDREVPRIIKIGNLR